MEGGGGGGGGKRWDVVGGWAWGVGRKWIRCMGSLGVGKG